MEIKQLLFDSTVREDLLSRLHDVVPASQTPAIAKAIAVFYEKENLASETISWVIKREVENTNSGDILFRDDSLTTRIIFEYLALFGRVYMKRTLRNAMKKALSTKASAEDNFVKNPKLVLSLCDKFFEAIVESSTYIPNNFRTILYHVANTINTKFPSHSLVVAGGFLYFRILAPPIASPHVYGFTNEAPKPGSQRLLVLVSKILQRITTGILFEDDNQFSVFNEYVERKRADWEKFLGYITKIHRTLPNDFAPISLPIADAAYIVFHNFLVTNVEALMTTAQTQGCKTLLDRLKGTGTHQQPSDNFEHLIDEWSRQYEKEALDLFNFDPKERHKLIERSLSDSAKELRREVKLLMLGPGESGKSTIVKQLRQIHMNGFKKNEALEYIGPILMNVLGCIHDMLNGCKKLGLEISEENKSYAEYFQNLDSVDREEADKLKVDYIQALWKDPAFQAAFERASEFQLYGSCDYWMQNMQRVITPDYVPTFDDLVRMRIKTSGVVETRFQLDNVPFRLVDVGGQRSERRKWIHCFEDITSIIFCMAINEYDMQLYEDESVNRLVESFNLFESICSNKIIAHVPIIVFLNKSDLFKKKISKVDLNVCFPEYTGGCNFEKAVAFIQDKLEKRKGSKKREVYSHVTCATDTQNIAFVFESCRSIILNKLVANAGIDV